MDGTHFKVGAGHQTINDGHIRPASSLTRPVPPCHVCAIRTRDTRRSNAQRAERGFGPPRSERASRGAGAPDDQETRRP